MGVKKSFIDFLNFSHVDLIILMLASLSIFAGFWNFLIIKIVGILTSLLGFFIWICGLITLGESFDALPRAKRLVTSGIYSKIRNPIYLGGGLVYVGLIIYTIDVPLLNYMLIGIFIIGFVMQLIRIKKEEKILQRRFGRKYIKYKDGTWF